METRQRKLGDGKLGEGRLGYFIVIDLFNAGKIRFPGGLSARGKVGGKIYR